jgi:photosystem II stability/assembly factor-like uncharacterized protein
MMKKYILICIIGIVSQSFGQWIPVKIPTSASFRAMKSIGNHIWAGGTQGTFGHSSDAGKTWKFMQIPGAEKLDFRDLVILTEQEVLLMSAGPSEEGKASIWRTDDDGKNWTIIFEKKEPGHFFDCFQWDSKKQEGWLLADPIQQKLTLFHFKGNYFTPVSVEKAPMLQKNEAFFAASGSSLILQKDNFLLVGGGGPQARIYQKKDLNSDWRFIETSVQTGEAKGYFSIGAKNKKSYWAVGGDYRKLNESSIPILTSKDGGDSWQVLTNTPTFYMEKVIWAKPYWLVSGPSQSAAYHEKKKQWKNLGPSSYHNIIQVGEEIWGIGAKGQLGKISLSSIDALFLTEK